MKVLMSVAVWGREYAETFVRYCLASQLSAGNIEALLERHEFAYHVVTTRDDAEWMRGQKNVQLLCDHCQIIWDYIEDLGFNLEAIPCAEDGEKYPFMSRLQNVAFERSLESDALIFNYADFVWADGSIPGIIEMLGSANDAVLGFCLPVDSRNGKRKLEETFLAEPASGVLTLPPRALAGLVIDNMHDEARLRMWDGPAFTTTPTYLLWPVGTEGMVARVYHQTVLALRVKPDDPEFRAGIPRGSLDGFFSSALAERGQYSIAADSDQVLVFSLYDAISDTRLPPFRKREDALKHCLKSCIGPGQRHFSDVPLKIKRRFDDGELWERVEQRSQDVINEVHRDVPVDAAAFEKHSEVGEIARLEQRWKGGPENLHLPEGGRIRPVSLAFPPRVYIVSLLRALYVGRLFRIVVMPWLDSAKQQQLKGVAVEAAEVRVIDFREVGLVIWNFLWRPFRFR